MITTSDTIIVEQASIEKYDGPTLVCYPKYFPDAEVVQMEMGIQDGTGVTAINLKYVTYTFTKADIDAQSVAATGNVDKWMEAIEEKTKAYLEALNPGATFTIV